MPPKAKLHKDKGKLKVLPKSKSVLNNIQNESESNPSAIDEQRQFEVELCWCIQQLQTALSSGKLNPKQAQDSTKTLNTLMSNSAPLIKKRQLMRLSFGDYRAKMVEEEKKLSKMNHQVKLKIAKPSTKSVFVKKAPFLTSDKNFKFNFNCSLEEQAVEDINKLNLKQLKPTEHINKFRFQPSDNAFRFNFMHNTE